MTTTGFTSPAFDTDHDIILKPGQIWKGIDEGRTYLYHVVLRPSVHETYVDTIMYGPSGWFLYRENYPINTKSLTTKNERKKKFWFAQPNNSDIRNIESAYNRIGW